MSQVIVARNGGAQAAPLDPAAREGPAESLWAALTLAERRSLGWHCRGEAGSLERAHRRLKRWRDMDCFKASELFQARLNADSMTEAALVRVIATPVSELGAAFVRAPLWMQAVRHAFAHDEADGFGTNGQAGAAFLGAAAPFVRPACASLERHIADVAEKKASCLGDPAAVAKLFLEALLQRVTIEVTRPLILEMHVARVRGELTGDTPHLRYQSFVANTNAPAWRARFFQEYPVLARVVHVTTQNWLKAVSEFVQRLSNDWAVLESQFGDATQGLGRLTSVKMGAGDVHRGGRSVFIAYFDSGTAVVYKPRALEVDRHFAALLVWLRRRGADPDLKVPSVIDRGDYGWAEYVKAKPCESSEDIARFYRRHGALLAVLYALDATDVHIENLIASGDHPVLVDLESLFHPRPTRNRNWTGLDRVVETAMGQSVLRVGLLPQRSWAQGDALGIDVTALGGTGGQLTPFTVPTLNGAGTDELRLVRERQVIAKYHNRAEHEGDVADPADYVEQVTAGFISTYRTLLEHRADLLAETGPIHSFARTSVRAVLRATRTYGTLLGESYHPDLLRDALDRDRHFDHLWAAVASQPQLERVVAAERRELEEGDIPLFTARPDSTSLWTSSGEELTGFFAEAPLNAVKRRVEGFSASDLERQLWFIRASIASTRLGHETTPTPGHTPPPRRTTTRRRATTPAEFTGCAEKVGDRLLELSLCDADERTWYGLSLVEERTWRVAPVSGDLYAGASGIAMFLAYLGHVTGEARYRIAAQEALTLVLRSIEPLLLRTPVAPLPIGGFSGFGGTIYALAHLGVLWEDRGLFETAQRLAGALGPYIASDEHCDVIGGSAGLILALLALDAADPASTVAPLVQQCEEHLASRAQVMSSGLGWPNLAGDGKALAGFSHGASGIAVALARSAARFGSDAARSMVEQAVTFERTLFSAAEDNWIDLRPEAVGAAPGNGAAMWAWCHGAPGIGLARAELLQLGYRGRVNDDLQAAVRSTLRHGRSGNHCLCHGSLGNLELLRRSIGVMPDRSIRAAWRAELRTVVADVARGAWRTGIPLGIETPGLMTGLAGIGYSLLRCGNSWIPSVLTLESPEAANVPR
jgi:type 2 lantibiotic biosynthesis protein LanM